MADLNLSQKLKKISESLVLADANDIQSIAELHTDFEGLASDLSEDHFNSSIAQSTADYIESILLGEMKDNDLAFEIVGKVVSALQLVLCNNYDHSEVVFPKEILDSLSNDAQPAPVKTEKIDDDHEDLLATAPPLEQQCADNADENKDSSSEFEPDAEIQERIRLSTVNAINADSTLMADFISEANEHLESCNELLLTLETNCHDNEIINAIFRAFHTIKGVASFLNLNEVRELSHIAENVLDKARSGDIDLQGIVLDTIFESVDTLKGMIDDLHNSLEAGVSISTACGLPKLIDTLDRLNTSEIKETPVPENKPIVTKPEPQIIEHPVNQELSGSLDEFDPELPIEIVVSEGPKFIIEAREHLDSASEKLLQIEKTPNDEESLNALFRDMHTIKGSSGFLGLIVFEKLTHEAESLLGLVREGSITLNSQGIDTLFACTDALKIMCDRLEESLKSGQIKYSVANVKDLEEQLTKLRSGEILEIEPKPEPKQQAAPQQQEEKKTQSTEFTSVAPEPQDNQQGQKTQNNQIKKAVVKETVKVDSDRLNKLVDMIGELVIAETMVVQADELRTGVSKNLKQHLVQLDKITRELQAMGSSLRMVPINSTFQKMARLARDLSKKIDKDVEFVMTGEDTELDKTVVDSIGDPLVHMVRNAIDHGIEDSSFGRIEAGKPAKARVELRAFHRGGNIYIEIEDDGRGLNKTAIVNKAIENGVIDNGDGLSEKEINQLIFAPGFSTAEQITEVSGRGVGMDVVRRNIESMRGKIEIQSTQGKGSIFTIKLPLTMAIIDGMVIQVNQENYIIPTLSILMTVSMKKAEINTVQNKGQLIKLQDELIPIFKLEDLFEHDIDECDSNDEHLIVVIENDGKKTGLVIDDILGQQQIVIKSMGEYLQGVPGLAGSAIMADGTVGLILDINSLVKLANS